jgi:hypothetical protein
VNAQSPLFLIGNMISRYAQIFACLLVQNKILSSTREIMKEHLNHAYGVTSQLPNIFLQYAQNNLSP